MDTRRTIISKYSPSFPVLRGPLNLGFFIGHKGIMPLCVKESAIKWLKNPIENIIAVVLSKRPTKKPMASKIINTQIL